MATGQHEPLCLQVLVGSATDLYKKDIFGLCDPYVKLTLKRKNKTLECYATRKKKKTLNPDWKEKFVFKNKINLQHDSLLLEVFDENRLTRDNFLGKLHFKLQHLPIEMRKADIYTHGNSATYPLKPRSAKSRVSGTLKLKFLYYNTPPPRSTNPGSNNLAMLVEGSTGRASPQMAGTNGINRQTSADSWAVIDQDESSEPLPDGWEERQDANGRVFFVDHANRATQWDRPTQPSTATADQRAAQAASDRRRMMAATLARRNPGNWDTMSVSGSSLNLSQSSLAVPSLPPSEGRRPLSTPPRSVSLPDPTLSRPLTPTPATHSTSNTSPLTRQQGLRTTESASALLPSPRAAAAAAASSGEGVELPPGWEKRVHANGRFFYIDHNTRKTQWERPRSSPSLSRPMSIAAIPSPSSSSGGGEGRPAADLGPLPSGFEERSTPDGKKFYIDHATRSTQWEDPRLIKLKKQAAAAVPYSRDYKQKYENLKKHLNAKKPTDLPRVFEVPVRRNHVFEDSHRSIMGCKNKDHLKTRLWVKFDGEKGLDYGGVSREWFFLLSHEMLNPYYGLFEYAASDNYTLQVNPDSGFCNEHHLEYFRFIGRILAMAIYHTRLIDAFFIRPFYKMLIGRKVTLLDMEAVDTEFYNSIKYILENDPEPLCLTFTASREFLGQVEEIELKPGGTDIDVTEDNRKEYIDLLVKWRFENRIGKQMEAIKKGFSDIFSLKLLHIFDEREVEYVLCGLAEINVADWERNTVYSNGYKADDDAVIWFWKAVENFDSEMRARLLQFATGTSKVPMNGFGELQGSNGPQKFCLKRLGEPSSLPRAHTCFNRVDLPPYRSYHELKEKVRLAIENTEGFEGVD